MLPSRRPSLAAALWAHVRAAHATTGDPPAAIFDRALKLKQARLTPPRTRVIGLRLGGALMQRDRAAGGRADGETDPLQAEIADRLLDRLEDCTRDFCTAATIGGAATAVARQLWRGRKGLQTLIHVDGSARSLAAAAAVHASDAGRRPRPALFYLQGDEEHLPLAPQSVDVIISCLGLHWVNDVPGAMSQCRAALKPDGLFLAAMLGGNTLQELRIACHAAELERRGGVGARTSPLAQVRDAGNLLTRAGFSLPAVDVDTITGRYPSAPALVGHLRAMAETGAPLRRAPLRRDAALAAAAAYAGLFGESLAESGTESVTESMTESVTESLPATYQVIFMTGWAPGGGQQAPSRRGSATVSLADLARLSDERGAPGAVGPGRDAVTRPPV